MSSEMVTALIIAGMLFAACAAAGVEALTQQPDPTWWQLFERRYSGCVVTGVLQNEDTGQFADVMICYHRADP